MTSFLSQDLGQNALIEAKFDRLFFSFKSNQTFTLSPANMTMLDKQIIDKFDNAVDQLKFYEREIEANLVPHVFQLLLPRLKGQLREGSQVLSTVSSKSFSQIKFIFETVLPTAVTHVSLVSLPHRMEGENLYNLAVSNSSVDLYSTETIQDSFSSIIVRIDYLVINRHQSSKCVQSRFGCLRKLRRSCHWLHSSCGSSGARLN